MDLEKENEWLKLQLNELFNERVFYHKKFEEFKRRIKEYEEVIKEQDAIISDLLKEKARGEV